MLRCIAMYFRAASRDRVNLFTVVFILLHYLNLVVNQVRTLCAQLGFIFLTAVFVPFCDCIMDLPSLFFKQNKILFLELFCSQRFNAHFFISCTKILKLLLFQENKPILMLLILAAHTL